MDKSLCEFLDLHCSDLSEKLLHADFKEKGYGVTLDDLSQYLTITHEISELKEGLSMEPLFGNHLTEREIERLAEVLVFSPLSQKKRSAPKGDESPNLEIDTSRPLDGNEADQDFDSDTLVVPFDTTPSEYLRTNKFIPDLPTKPTCTRQFPQLQGFHRNYLKFLRTSRPRCGKWLKRLQKEIPYVQDNLTRIERVYRTVLQQGGYENMISNRKSEEIALQLNFDSQTDLVNFYSKYISCFDYVENAPENKGRKASPYVYDDIDLSKLKEVPLILQEEHPWSQETWDIARKEDIVMLRGYQKDFRWDESVLDLKSMAEKYSRQRIDVVHQSEEEKSFAPAYQAKKTMSLGRYFEYMQSKKHTDDAGYFKFAVNIDIGSWEEEIQELRKFPSNLSYGTKDDALKYLNKDINGMNLPQIYMKVKGSWTGAHQENVSVRSINTNHGKEPCIWWAVAEKYVPKLYQLVKAKYGMDMLKREGEYMPDIKFLMANGIEVYQFKQYHNDVVIVGPGCLHWVKSGGVTMNSSWNFFSLELAQFKSAFRRATFNSANKILSLVPVNTTALQVLREGSTEIDHELSQFLKARVTSKLRREEEFKRDYVPSSVEFEPQPCGADAAYCELCQEEILNYWAYCYDCDQLRDESRTLFTYIFCLACSREHLRKQCPTKALTYFHKFEPADFNCLDLDSSLNLSTLGSLDYDLSGPEFVVETSVSTSLKQPRKQPRFNAEDHGSSSDDFSVSGDSDSGSMEKKGMKTVRSRSGHKKRPKTEKKPRSMAQKRLKPEPSSTKNGGEVHMINQREIKKLKIWTEGKNHDTLVCIPILAGEEESKTENRRQQVGRKISRSSKAPKDSNSRVTPKVQKPVVHQISEDRSSENISPLKQETGAETETETDVVQAEQGEKQASVKPLLEEPQNVLTDSSFDASTQDPNSMRFDQFNPSKVEPQYEAIQTGQPTDVGVMYPLGNMNQHGNMYPSLGHPNNVSPIFSPFGLRTGPVYGISQQQASTSDSLNYLLDSNRGRYEENYCWNGASFSPVREETSKPDYTNNFELHPQFLSNVNPELCYERIDPENLNETKLDGSMPAEGSSSVVPEVIPRVNIPIEGSTKLFFATLKRDLEAFVIHPIDSPMRMRQLQGLLTQVSTNLPSLNYKMLKEIQLGAVLKRLLVTSRIDDDTRTFIGRVMDRIQTQVYNDLFMAQAY